MTMQHTLQMRQEMQHPYARRLKAPRSGPAHAPPGPVTTSDTKALRGDRWRILLLLQAHPDGLSPAQTPSAAGAPVQAPPPSPAPQAPPAEPAATGG